MRRLTWSECLARLARLVRAVRSACWARCVLAGVLALAVSAGIGETSARASAAGLSARMAAAGHAPAARGANLLGNAGAQLGAASVQGWDSVTIPGWRIVRGLPTVVRYGTAGFPVVTGRFPATRGGQLFSGGLGGTAVLSQQIPLAGPGGALPRPGTEYRLSGWLGGTRSSRASVTVHFLSAAGRVLASRTIGPVGCDRAISCSPAAGQPGHCRRGPARCRQRENHGATRNLVARRGRRERGPGRLQPRGG